MGNCLALQNEETTNIIKLKAEATESTSLTSSKYVGLSDKVTVVANTGKEEIKIKLVLTKNQVKEMLEEFGSIEDIISFIHKQSVEKERCKKWSPLLETILEETSFFS